MQVSSEKRIQTTNKAVSLAKDGDGVNQGLAVTVGRLLPELDRKYWTR
jgi:hypothetical protein